MGGGGDVGEEELIFVSWAFPVLRIRPMLFRAEGGRERRLNCGFMWPGLAASDLKQMLLRLHFPKIYLSSSRDVPHQTCSTVPRQQCVSVPTRVPEEKCFTIPREQCGTVQKQVPQVQCQQAPREQCTTVPRQQCQSVPRQQCR